MSLSPNPASLPTKRRRLNSACNYCRSRKTRCDEQKPSCHACLAAGLPCITTDPKRPDRHVERREAGKRPTVPGTNSTPGPSPRNPFSEPQSEGVQLPPILESHIDDSTIQHGNNEQHEPASRLTPEERPASAHTADATSGRKFRGLLPIMKQDSSSSAVEILTGWLNVALFRLGFKQRFLPPLVKDPESRYLSYPAKIPNVPDIQEAQRMIPCYFRRVNALYPVLEREEILASLSMAQSHGIEVLCMDPSQLCRIVVLLMVLDLGSVEISTESSPGLDALPFCKDMVGRLMSSPTVASVKALFMIALSSYHRDDLAFAGLTVGLCVSMASAIGLNKSRSGTSSPTRLQVDETGRRMWWCIFVFEKLLSFELGRLSTIPTCDIPRIQPATLVSQPIHEGDLGGRDTLNCRDHHEAQSEATEFMKAVVSLAKLLGDIGSRCIHVREREESSPKDDLPRIVAEKIKTTGEACLMLTKWAEDLPDNLRPNSDLIYDTRTFPQAAFLSMHYQNALLVLTRNALLISESALHTTTEVMAKNQPWDRVIRNGQSMVANVARRLIKLYIEAEDIAIPLLIPHANVSLHALYVLAVHLLRHPNSRLAEADLQLIHHAADFAKQHASPHSAATPVSHPLDRILREMSDILKPNIGFSPGSNRAEQLNAPGKYQEQFPMPVPVPKNTSNLPAAMNLDVAPTHDIFGPVPPSHTSPSMTDDTSVFDTLYYHGMDMGTWMGLDDIGKDWDEDMLATFRVDADRYEMRD